MLSIKHFALPLLAAVALLCGCSHSQKRYQLNGTVISIDSTRGNLSVSHDAIPGFMPAMLMEYRVKNASALQQLHLNDSITADLVVAGDRSWLENIRVTAKAPAQPVTVTNTSAFHMPQPGEQVPDFRLVDQNSRTFSLSSLRGRPLAITFIYSRCPLPDYCPRMNSNFAELLKSETVNSQARNLRLLSISFDPEHDTPEVLRLMHAQWTHGRDAHSWTFAVIPKKTLPRVLEWFGLTALPDQGMITHSLSTTLIAPDGKVIAWWHGNSWTPADIMKAWSDYTHRNQALSRMLR